MATLSEHLTRDYARNHTRLLEAAQRVDETEFGRSVAPSLHSLAYQLWHVARWTDAFARSLSHPNPALAAAAYPGLAEPVEIWIRDDLARRWGLPAGGMGRHDSGTELSDEDADRLGWPPRPDVVDYARRAFELGERVVAAIPDAQLLEAAVGDPDGDSYAENVLIYAEHDARHLGMMEALIGLLGGRGTSTR